MMKFYLLVLFDFLGQTALTADLPAFHLLTNRPFSGIKDLRAEVAQATQVYRAQHFPDGKLPPKHDFSQFQPAKMTAGKVSSAPPKTATEPTPGGIGYGIWYDNGALEWSNSAVVDFYPITPNYLGQSVSTLYLTSTCRAQKGTESLIAYTGANFPEFWVFDWSQTNNYWQVFFLLQTNYLTQRLDESGVSRQMAHIRNGTYYLGMTNHQYQFENLVLLFDFYRNGWDLMYSTNYLLGSLTNNYYDSSSGGGTWGPIVETFNSYSNVVAVGFDLCRLVQDGNINWLAPSDAYVSVNEPESGLSTSTNWQLLTVAPYTSFATTITNGNVASSQQTNFGAVYVTANTNLGSFWLNPNLGAASTGWVVSPGSNSWDQAYVGLPPGGYTVQFVPVPGFVTPTQQQIMVAANNITSLQAAYATNQIPPAILSEPVPNQLYLTGQTIALTAEVTGTAPLSYQWLENTTNGLNLAGPNGYAILGPNSNVLTITEATITNTGSYLLIITNIYGAVTSTVANVNWVAYWPVEYFTDVGGPASWNSAATNWGAVSGGPYTYVWFPGVNAVFEGTGGLVNVSNVTAGNIGFNAAGYMLAGGNLTLSGTPLVTMGNGATIGSVLSDQGGGFSVTGPGALTLSGSNNYTGPLTLSNGIVILGGSNSLSGISAGTWITNQGTLNLNGMNLGQNNNPVMISGTNPIVNGATLEAWLENVTLFGATTFSNSSATHGPICFGSTTGAGGTLNLNGYTLTVSVASSNPVYLTGLTMSNAGNIVINRGTLQLSDPYGEHQQSVNLSGPGTLFVNPGGTMGSARWGEGQTITMPIVLNGGTIGSVYPGPNGATYACPITLSNNSVINMGGGYGNAVFSGAISGGYGLTVTGDSNTRTFTGTNTYSGWTTIGAGALLLSGSGCLGGGNYSGLITNNGILNDGSSAPQTLAGVISGTGSLIQSGGGMLTLSAANTYSGTTTVSNGVLTLSGSGRLGNGNYSGLITNNGILNNGSSTAQTLAGVISGTGSLVQTGGGTLTLSAANTYSGTTTVSNGVLLVAASGVIPTNTVTVLGGGTLTGLGTVRGAVVNNGTLALGTNGIGTLSISNALTFGAGSTTTLAINRAAGTNTFGRAKGMSSATFGGTLTVTSTGGSFTNGDSFTLFSAAAYANNFTATNLPAGLGSNLRWIWNPARGTLAAGWIVNPNPTNLLALANHGVLQLSWPADHTGWRLLVQTNRLTAGLSLNTNDWGELTGSSGTNLVYVPLTATNPLAFYRLVYP